MNPREKSELERWRVSVDDAAGGLRLDRFVSVKAAASRAQVRRWLNSACVAVDGSVVTRGGETLRAGQMVVLTPPDSSWIGGMDSELRALARGHDWVAVDKPAGVAVHPLSPDEPGTLLGAVAAAYSEVVGVGDEGELRSGVVHRLDVDTSGVTLFALSNRRWQSMREAFSTHRVNKTYVALVAGQLNAGGQSDRTLAVTRHTPARVSVVDAATAEHVSGARMCSLAWRVLAVGSDCTRVEIDLHTGFLHQARVMFAAMGFPLLGDAVYAPADVAERAARHMLHAVSIAVDDVAAQSAWPNDFREVAEREGLA
ncbi:MAG: pseudouridine synthase [Planctomycetota bacterium]